MKHPLLILFVMFLLNASAQNVYFPIGSDGYYEALRASFSNFRNPKLDRQLNQFHQSLYSRNDSIVLLEATAEENQQKIRFQKPLLKCFYKDGTNFYKLEKEDEYVLIINPIINASSGMDDTGMVWQNTRGVEIKGNIGGMARGIGFYSELTDNQAVLPSDYRYFTDSLNFVPNELFYKKYKNKGGVDYFRARAYITFNAVKNYLRFQFGHDKHKIGNGYRSMILSDFAPQYLFLKINTEVGRFHYQNLFTQFSDNGPIMSNVLFGKKYGAFHRLSFDVRHNINIGLNEMVIFDRIDSTQMNQFDFNYLNPVIFYRSVESNLGSRDNSLMALDAQWKIRGKYSIYGQFVLDEFNLKFIKTQPNWWANKYAYQLGVLAMDLARIKRLDVRLEYNRSRPYTYSHMRSTQSLSHFNQALAHPLGSNFSEGIVDVKYQIKNRLNFNLTGVFAKMGRDSFLNGSNYGANILRSYDTRVTDFDSKIFMGKLVNFRSINFSVSYALRPNINMDVRVNHRQYNSQSNYFFTLGFRMNAAMKAFDY